ncbi:hypothetical protein SSAG_04573 [Streptomyces sp. Mg1]|nr:hypothetical protein SSAG_04573 [Streptomyces sp. Mg1]
MIYFRVHRYRAQPVDKLGPAGIPVDKEGPASLFRSRRPLDDLPHFGEWAAFIDNLPAAPFQPAGQSFPFTSIGA